MTLPLQVAALSVSYGGVRALADCHLEVRPNQLVGLIGPNGAGKTTLIDAVTGFARASGSVKVEEQELGGMAPDERARFGVARTWQSLELFNELSVYENLAVVAARPTRWQSVREVMRGRAQPLAPVDEALELLNLGSVRDSLPSSLTQEQRKLLGVARAVVADPKILLLDEPAAGLDTKETGILGSELRALATSGRPTLLIDHDVNLVMSICDYVYVLDFGRLISQGTPSQVRKDERVIVAYLGRAASAASSEEPAT